MKLSRIFIGFALATIALTGCGKKGQKTGTKTTFEKFMNAVNNLPDIRTQPYKNAIVEYEDVVNSKTTKFKANFTWAGNTWEPAEDAPEEGAYRMTYYVNLFLQNNIETYYEYDKRYGNDVEWFSNPLSVKLNEDDGNNLRTYIWNDYGLLTYFHQDFKHEDEYDPIIASMTVTIKYSKSGGSSSTSSQTSQHTSEGGAEEVKKVSKAEFDQAAVQRTNISESGYKNAKLTLKHYQKVQGQSRNDEFFANYTLSDGAWVMGSNNFPSNMQTYARMINFLMTQAQTFIDILQSKLVNLYTTYSIGNSIGELGLSGNADSADMVGSINAAVTWDKNGLFKSFYEKDEFSYYQGFENIEIEETISVAYTK